MATHQLRGTLDPRFGDPDATATDWETVTQTLDHAPLFWISTVRGDGHPHVTPLVALWVAGALHFCTGAEEQKNLNLEASPHVALTTGCNQWEEGIDIVVEGDAERATAPQTLRDLAEAWTGKWDGRWQFEVIGDTFAVKGATNTPLVYRIEPSKVIAFAKNPFSQTTYRF